MVGDRGELRLQSADAHFPSALGPISRRKRVESFPRHATYAYQLDAFAAAVLRGEPVKTTPEEAIENMTVIDAIYRACRPLAREPA